MKNLLKKQNVHERLDFAIVIAINTHSLPLHVPRYRTRCSSVSLGSTRANTPRIKSVKRGRAGLDTVIATYGGRKGRNWYRAFTCNPRFTPPAIQFSKMARDFSLPQWQMGISDISHNFIKSFASRPRVLRTNHCGLKSSGSV
jgi:hypothetical protein